MKQYMVVGDVRIGFGHLVSAKSLIDAKKKVEKMTPEQLDVDLTDHSTVVEVQSVEEEDWGVVTRTFNPDCEDCQRERKEKIHARTRAASPVRQGRQDRSARNRKLVVAVDRVRPRKVR